MSDEIKVALLGNGILREGLHRILSENSISVTSATKDVDEIDLPELQSKPGHDIILIDGGLAKPGDELYADLQQRHPTASLVVLADSFEFEEVVNAFRSGVAGYIIKDISPKPLVESLRLVALGEKVLPSEMAMFLGTRSYPMGWSAHLANVNLSEREIQVLQLLILGAPNKVIGRRLGICEATVKVHVKAALRKLHVSNRTQAAIWAVQCGLMGYGADGFQTATALEPPAPVADRKSVN